MTKILIRHGLSEANNRENIGNLAFASADAPLMELGREQAQLAATSLRAMYGDSVFHEQIAVSSMLRTQQTAEEMGFTTLNAYPELSEVVHGVELQKLGEMLKKDILPEAAIVVAEKILEQPPTEGIWVTHGLVIAGLCKVLGVNDDKRRMVPRFCEMRELPIL